MKDGMTAENSSRRGEIPRRCTPRDGTFFSNVIPNPAIAG